MMNLNIKPEIRDLAFERGIQYPSTEELLMLILGSGNKSQPVQKLAENVFDTLAISQDDKILENLVKIPGMGKSKALAVAAALELGRRNYELHATRIVKPADLYPFVRNFTIKEQEHFLCITLNGAHELKNIKLISVGTINKTIIHPREVFHEAIRENAATIILCHNHPSGDIYPSEEDIETTGVLMKVADLVGIPILDHIIVSQTGWFSFAEHELLFTCNS